MNRRARTIPPDTLRPESQPHGTTEDQIHEMESEGPGAKVHPKPKGTPPARAAAVPRARRRS